MKPWEKAVADFLAEWKEKPEVIGAMVCGSYITGNPTKRSDIDLHLILSDEVDWRERGNKVVSGFLIEYFANPPKQIRGYFREDDRDRRSMSMVQFLTGHIIFDPTGVIAELKAEAKMWMKKKHSGLDVVQKELRKYGVWDDLDNVTDCYEQQRADFHFTYYHSLNRLFTTYSTFLGVENIPFYQVASFLADPAYLNKYLKSRFPDEPFKETFMKAIQETDPAKMMEHHVQLSKHVLDQMGGFEIDGWKIRSPIEG